MRQVMDWIYLYREPDNARFRIYGIDFREFASAVPRPLNLLLLTHEFNQAKHCPIQGFLCVLDEQIDSLITDNIYGYGDFSWIDFRSMNDLPRLTKQEIAEICYLARLGTPFDSPFFSALNNRFVYLGHDDGWWLRLYCNGLDDMIALLSNTISDKLSHLGVRGSVPIAKGLCGDVLDRAGDGILLRLPHGTESKRQNVVIPIRAMGDASASDMNTRNFDRLERLHPSTESLVYDAGSWSRKGAS